MISIVISFWGSNICLSNQLINQGKDCIFNSGEYRIVVYKNSHNIIIVLIKQK